VAGCYKNSIAAIALAFPFNISTATLTGGVQGYQLAESLTGNIFHFCHASSSSKQYICAVV
jgi:hypothetical protein